MHELIKKHFALCGQIAKLNRDKAELTREVVKALADQGHFEYFTINWARLYRHEIGRNIRELQG